MKISLGFWRERHQAPEQATERFMLMLPSETTKETERRLEGAVDRGQAQLRKRGAVQCMQIIFEKNDVE